MLFLNGQAGIRGGDKTDGGEVISEVSKTGDEHNIIIWLAAAAIAVAAAMTAALRRRKE